MPLRRLSIRSPSLLLSQSQSTPLRSSSSLTRPLPNPLKRLLQSLISLLILHYEFLTFLYSTRFNCSGFDERPSEKGLRWNGRDWVKDERWKGLEGFRVLVVTDPQLLDMNSYEGRGWVIKQLGIWVSKVYEKKVWWIVNSFTRGGSRGRVKGVVWNGDLGDNLIELAQTKQGYDGFVKGFRRLFPLPRRNSLSASELDPPIPVVYVPGNHDVGLYRESQLRGLNETELSRGREKFEESFGRLWGEVEWGGWKVVWIDSMGLIEGGERGREMRNWIEELGKGEVTQPRLLFSHVPLWRPSGTGCGKARESRRNKGGIEQGRGKGYQNLVGEEETKWLLENVRPEGVFSGDDHDSCLIQHPYRSPLTSLPITETTVKSFSMVMGVTHPGYTLLNLYPPLPPTPGSPSSNPLPTFTSNSCTLPSQLSIYLHIYLPLSISLFLFFLLPKLLVILRSFLYKRRRSRHTSSARGHNGSSMGHKRSLSRTLLMRDNREEELEEGDELFPTFPSTPASSEYSYSANLGDEYDGDGVSSNRVNGRDLWGNSAREEEEEELMSSKKVRRVSRVWLWDKSGNSSSPSLPFSNSSNSRYDDSSTSLTARLRSIFHSLLNRLSQNTLLLPLLRLLRPLLRLLRTLVFVVFAKPLVFVGRLVGGEKGVGRAFSEAGREFLEVAIGGIAVWVIVLVWIGM